MSHRQFSKEDIVEILNEMGLDQPKDMKQFMKDLKKVVKSETKLKKERKENADPFEKKEINKESEIVSNCIKTNKEYEINYLCRKKNKPEIEVILPACKCISTKSKDNFKSSKESSSKSKPRSKSSCSKNLKKLKNISCNNGHQSKSKPEKIKKNLPKLDSCSTKNRKIDIKKLQKQANDCKSQKRKSVKSRTKCIKKETEEENRIKYKVHSSNSEFYRNCITDLITPGASDTEIIVHNCPGSISPKIILSKISKTRNKSPICLPFNKNSNKKICKNEERKPPNLFSSECFQKRNNVTPCRVISSEIFSRATFTIPNSNCPSEITPKKRTFCYKPNNTNKFAIPNDIKRDSVALYEYYKCIWDKRRIPGENKHMDIRWNVRNVIERKPVHNGKKIDYLKGMKINSKILDSRQNTDKITYCNISK